MSLPETEGAATKIVMVNLSWKMSFGEVGKPQSTDN